MNDVMWNGFIDEINKVAYDYQHEADVAEEEAGRRYQDEPLGYLPTMGVGSGIGAGMGAGVGLMAGKSPGKAALIGALIGATMGAVGAASDKMEVGEARAVMNMPKKQRERYLKSRERMRQQNVREMAQSLREDKKHRELISAVNRSK